MKGISFSLSGRVADVWGPLLPPADTLKRRRVGCGSSQLWEWGKYRGWAPLAVAPHPTAPTVLPPRGVRAGGQEEESSGAAPQPHCQQAGSWGAKRDFGVPAERALQSAFAEGWILRCLSLVPHVHRCTDLAATRLPGKRDVLGSG